MIKLKAGFYTFIMFLGMSSFAQEVEKEFESLHSNYTQKGCPLVKRVLDKFLDDTRLHSLSLCEPTPGKMGQFSIKFKVRGVAIPGKRSYFTPVCVDLTGFPFVDELEALAFNNGLRLTVESVHYTIGGPALCRPGRFNTLKLNWGYL